MNSLQPIGPVMIDLGGTSVTVEENEKLKHPNTGGIILFTRNFESPEQIKDLIFEIRSSRRGPLLIAVDQEGGRVQRFRQGFTPLPPASRYQDNYEKDQSHALETASLAGWVMASELLAVGIDFSFAPVLDVDSGVSEVIGDRSFSKHPEIVSQLAMAFQRGSRKAGMASVGKHFPGHGDVAPDSHLTLPEDHRPFEALVQRDLLPFRNLITSGLEAIMPAHILYPEVDDRPAGFSEIWIKQILRGQLGFKGAVFSDDLAMEAAAFAGNFTERVQTALQASCDMVLVCNNPEAAEQVLECLVPLPMQTVQQKRLLCMRAKNQTDFPRLVNDPIWTKAKKRLERFYS